MIHNRYLFNDIYIDGTMSELVDMLHKEEAGLTVDRSLEGNTVQ
jgi:hypothetical protein